MPSTPRTPPPGVVPGVASRAEQVQEHLAIPYVALFLGSPLVVLGLFGPYVSAWLLLAPSVLVVAGMMLASFLLRRRARSEVEQKRWRVCLGCRYDLSGCPPSGRCPECAQPFDPSLLERSWRWTYARTDD